jgi:hypothetical protein
MREEVTSMEFQIEKAEFSINLQTLNAKFIENPILLDKVCRYTFYSWNRATSRILNELRQAQSPA